MPIQENNAPSHFDEQTTDGSHHQGMDRDTFLNNFSDFEEARHNAAEAKAQSLQHSKNKINQSPAEIPLPDITTKIDEIGMERKVPRQMHLWFAAGLGLLACFAALAQGFMNNSPNPPAKPQEMANAPMQDSEPPLTKLQQELAHQRNEDGLNDASSLTPGKPKRNKQNKIQLASENISPSDLMADLPGQLPPGGVRSSDLMQHYENDKARALITGSKMLAVNHSANIAFNLSELTPGNISSQISNLIQSTPKAAKVLGDVLGQVPRPKIASASPVSTSSLALPAISPRPHAPGALVLEGTAIPCVLLSELRSDLPGMVVAQVSEDIFDSLQAEVRVIPRGARLIGHYDNRITNGQQRLMASFHRLILPNGTSLELEKMDGANADGTSGLKGDVDTHFWARFGQAFLTAGLARAIQPSATAAPNTGLGASVLGPNAAGQILIDTNRLDLQANGLLQPTITIHQGDPFVVMVNRDLALPALASY